MNIIDLQESLKDYPDNRLMAEYQRPTNNIPQFLILGELQRRKRMRDDYKRREAADMPTVAEEMITGAGVPQEGLMAMAGAMAPKTNVAQDTGLAQAMPMQATRAPQPQMMAEGGIVNYGFSNMTQYPFFRDNKLAATYDLSEIAAFIQRGYPREGLVTNFGEDAVREAESMILDKTDNYARYASGTGRAPLGIDGFKEIDLRRMEAKGLLGNKSYRDPSQSTYLGGERVNQNTDKAPTIDYTDPQSLQEIDPDSTTFVAPEAVSDPRLNMDTAGGLGSMSLDSSVPEMALDTPLSLRQIIDSGVGTRGADTDPAQQLAEFLASRRSDLPGVNLPGESYPYEINPDAAEKQGQAILDSLTPPPTGQQNNPNIGGPLSSALQYYGGTAFKGAATPEPTDEERRIIEGMSAVPEAGAKIETESAPDRSIDRQINPEKYMDLDDFLAQDSIRDRSSDRGSSLQYPTFLPYPTASGAFPNDAELAGQYPQRGGSETDFNLFKKGEEALAAIDQKLAAEGLSDSEIKALNVQKTALNFALSSGQAIDDAVGDAMALLNRLITEPVLNVAGVATSIVNPDAGAKVYDYADQFSSYIDDIARDGYIKDNRISNQKIAPKADEDRRGDPELTITEPTTIAKDAETSAAEAMRLQEESFDQPDPLSVLDSITDGGAGGAGFGSVESEIAKMISDRRKRADQNKWLALAEAGFAMMGPAATFGEGIGKGGKAGLAALRESQKGMDAFESDMLKLQANLDIAQQRSADTRYTAAQTLKGRQYTANKTYQGRELTAEASRKATQQRLNAAAGNQLKDMIDIYDSQLAELGVISGQAPPAGVADRYNQIIRERQAAIKELQRRTGLDVAATGGPELSGQFNVI
jgi:hypothetical protein